MLNALRLRNGFGLRDFTERKGLIERDFARVRPTVKGFDFLSDLQSLFLSNADK